MQAGVEYISPIENAQRGSNLQAEAGDGRTRQHENQNSLPL